jgi:hypothetical protein
MNSLRTTLSTSKLGRGSYKLSSVDNKDVKAYLEQFEDWSELPEAFKDVIEGACAQIVSSRPMNAKFIYRILQSMNVINADTVRLQMNPKQCAIYGSEYSRRSVYYYNTILKCSSSGILHQMYLKSATYKSNQFNSV